MRNFTCENPGSTDSFQKCLVCRYFVGWTEGNFSCTKLQFHRRKISKSIFTYSITNGRCTTPIMSLVRSGILVTAARPRVDKCGGRLTKSSRMIVDARHRICGKPGRYKVEWNSPQMLVDEDKCCISKLMDLHMK